MREEIAKIRENIKKMVIEDKKGNEELVILTLGEDEASSVYVKNKVKFGEEVGIKTRHIVCKDEEELGLKIMQYNINPNVTGIILQLPLPNGVNKDKYIDMIDCTKDVDGITTSNRRRLYTNGNAVIPATTLGCLYILTSFLDSIEGTDILLIGRSDLCNLPLAHVLREKNATVTIAHSKTKNLSEKISNTEVVISAVGKPNFITKDMISEKNKLLIDVAICRDENGKLCGDFSKEIYDMDVKITPVPRGAGALTIPCLFLNLINL